MIKPAPLSRRQFISRTALGLSGAASMFALPNPLWALTNQHGVAGSAPSTSFNLTIGPTPVTIDGRRAMATGINGTVPGPLLRWREGDTVTLDVSNELSSDSSLHWHGLLLPSGMDGVPGLSFKGIEPGETFRYRFPIRQNGTYWYHSHSGFQEQTGVYGPIIIDAAGEEPVDYDREFVLLLSDWTFDDPERLLNNLKVRDDYYNYNRRTLGEFFSDARKNGWSATVGDRLMWGSMRMKASDIADITAASYSYLVNGLDSLQNWTGLFTPGERLRLRVINGSAQTFFNVRIPGLEMTVIQADGQHVEPVTTDEFQIGVAETYDVIVEPGNEPAYTVFAETMDRSGYARGTLASRPGLSAPIPDLRPTPRVTMRDMGMNHGEGGHGGMSHDAQDDHPGSDHSGMTHSTMDHAAMDHGDQDAIRNLDNQSRTANSPTVVRHNHHRGPGVANIAENPVSRLHEPGQGLAGVPHRVLRYSQLRSLEPNRDRREPGRVLELHLTGNMERYMWSFDGIKYSEVDGPIRFRYGERLRLVLVNDTMMSHPMHLHGMFVELVNGNGRHNPRKHTVVVKPAERLEVDITADEPGHWAFHCHMLYHMKAGMMRSVLVEDTGAVT